MKRIIVSLAALFFGGMIYILWRTETLFMFSWFGRLGLGGVIAWLRAGAEPFSVYLPDWFIFSIPNAVWFFSGLILFDSIWGANSSECKLFWVSIFVVIAVGSEAAQAFQFIPGTFDYRDFLFMIIAGLSSALFIFSNKYRKKGGNSHES
jgi:hypothetical protein